MADESLGPYLLLDTLGRGGMGEVWRARDTRKDRNVALKVLGGWLDDDAEFVKRFKREAALAARLSSPHIVPIHDYGEIDGRLFIDMPLIRGTNLEKLIRTEGPLPVGRAVGIIDQAASALAEAHSAGLLHRDVKPSNIIVTQVRGDDHAYLIDFGIARAVDGTQISISGMLIGTATYMAPERFAGDGDHRADVYALGCVLYEAMAGRPPFTGTNILMMINAHQNYPVRPLSTLRPGIPHELDRVIQRALAKDPDQRFTTVGELASAARDALRPTVRAPTPAAGVTQTHALPDAHPPPTGTAVRRLGPFSALIVLFVAFLALLLFIVQNQSQITVHFLFWTPTLPIGMTILLPVVLTVLTMGVVASTWRRRR